MSDAAGCTAERKLNGSFFLYKTHQHSVTILGQPAPLDHQQQYDLLRMIWNNVSGTDILPICSLNRELGEGDKDGFHVSFIRLSSDPVQCLVGRLHRREPDESGAESVDELAVDFVV